MSIVPTETTIARRHDLDALRAIAMLLGILLHALMPFIGIPEEYFPLQDTSQAPWMAIGLYAIHGFRMPLFFLISGFFTAMLWRKRGLAALINHRFKRIFLPLLVGMVTIIPATWMAYSLPNSSHADIFDRTDSVPTGVQANPETPELFLAIENHDLRETTRLLDNGISPDSRHPDGYTALNACVYANSETLTQLLLERGAEPNYPSISADQNTPLHESAFWGQHKITVLLLDHGADPSIPNRNGIIPAVMAIVDINLAHQIADAIGLNLSRNEIQQGRQLVLEALNNHLTEKTDKPIPAEPLLDNSINLFEAPTDNIFQGKEDVLTDLMYAPVFHHLWFLWYLCWLIAAFALWVLFAEGVNLSIPRWLVMPPICFVWLLPLTYLFQNQMGFEPDSYGPDTATGLVPVPAILGYYFIFFFYGALYFDSNDEKGKLGKYWDITLPLAILLVFPLGLEFATGHLEFRHELADRSQYRLIAVILQVAYVWLMTCGSIGLFRRCFSQESARMRYISDSSYWLYLAHVPLLMAMQFAISEIPLPAIVKVIATVVVCSALLLISYEYCIRYTPIGTLLNGPKKRNADPIAVIPVVDLSEYKSEASNNPYRQDPEANQID